jgi:transposase
MRRRRVTGAPRVSKTLSHEATLAQKGVNLVERLVLDMDCIWNPTGAIDVGIDGTIELCDRAARAPLGLFLHVQVKATDGAWDRESEEGFAYTCRPQDLAYWLQGNAPVLLIVTRPAAGEAYWVSVKDFFRDPTRRQTRRVQFDKRADRFTLDAYQALLEVAVPRDAGLYLSPRPRPERLVSNLLEVTGFEGRIYLAETEVRRKEEAWGAFRRLRHLWADAAYAAAAVERAARYAGLTVAVVHRPPGLRGFAVQPRRWVVERTFGWLGRYRGLSKDYEALPASEEAWIYLAMTHLMPRRLEPH